MNEHTHHNEASSPGDAAASDAETRDPVCGMKVRADSPHRVTYDGHEVGFCGADCREKFRAEPAKFTAKAKGAAWPFYVRFVQSLKNRSLNMFTLIGLGVSVAYVYSLIAAVFPGMFPPSFREEGEVAVYFEAAAVIVTLILLGHVLELRARSQTDTAIKKLLGMFATSARQLLDDGTSTRPVKICRKLATGSGL